MTSGCLLCDKHVATGEAVLAVLGTLLADGTVVKTEPWGVMHRACVDSCSRGSGAGTAKARPAHETAPVILGA